MIADPKPQGRIVNPLADPYDSTPVDEDTCPFCGKYVRIWQKHHVVPRGQGGDDVSENLVWVCGPCHAKLPPQGTDWRVCSLLVAYTKLIPAYREYAESKKWPGWLWERYLGTKAAL